MKDSKFINNLPLNNVFRHIANTNNRNYNVLKALEEMAELSEKLLKSLTKSSELKPTKKEIIEEIGDVQIRLAVLSHQFGAEEVNTRVNYKVGRMKKRIKSGKYANHI